MQSFHQLFRAPLLISILCIAIFQGAQAAPPLSEGYRLYAPCSVCHQLSAWGSTDGSIPNLAGQRKQYLAKQLAEFKTAVRGNTAMQVVTFHRTVGNRHDLVALATYLSDLEPNPRPVEGLGDHLRVGQESFTHICAACHGPDGRGNRANTVPRIAGQHYPYLRRQIEMAADLHRDFAPPEMTGALRGMPSQEKDALADYISRLGNSDALLDSQRHDGVGK